MQVKNSVSGYNMVKPASLEARYAFPRILWYSGCKPGRMKCAPGMHPTFLRIVHLLAAAKEAITPRHTRVVRPTLQAAA